MSEDPWAGLEALTVEYRAASPRERNYQSARFADLFYYAAAELLIMHTGRWPPRPRLRVVGQEGPGGAVRAPGGATGPGGTPA